MSDSNTTIEIWKDIEGYKGLYQVSNLGRVKSLAGKRFGRCESQEKIMCSFPAPNGYLRIPFNVKGSRKSKSIHRLVAENFIPNPENKPTVNHKNGIKTDNRVENLEWATPKENIRHAHLNGLSISAKGSSVKGSKLTECLIPEIRAKYSTGKYTQKQLAAEYKVCLMSINLLVRGKTWAHVK